MKNFEKYPHPIHPDDVYGRVGTYEPPSAENTTPRSVRHSKNWPSKARNVKPRPTEIRALRTLAKRQLNQKKRLLIRFQHIVTVMNRKGVRQERYDAHIGRGVHIILHSLAHDPTKWFARVTHNGATRLTAAADTPFSALHKIFSRHWFFAGDKNLSVRTHSAYRKKNAQVSEGLFRSVTYCLTEADFKRAKNASKRAWVSHLNETKNLPFTWQCESNLKQRHTPISVNQY